MYIISCSYLVNLSLAWIVLNWWKYMEFCKRKIMKFMVLVCSWNCSRQRPKVKLGQVYAGVKIIWNFTYTFYSINAIQCNLVFFSFREKSICIMGCRTISKITDVMYVPVTTTNFMEKLSQSLVWTLTASHSWKKIWIQATRYQ